MASRTRQRFLRLDIKSMIHKRKTSSIVLHQNYNIFFAKDLVKIMKKLITGLEIMFENNISDKGTYIQIM